MVTLKVNERTEKAVRSAMDTLQEKDVLVIPDTARITRSIATNLTYGYHLDMYNAEYDCFVKQSSWISQNVVLIILKERGLIK